MAGGCVQCPQCRTILLAPAPDIFLRCGVCSMLMSIASTGHQQEVKSVIFENNVARPSSADSQSPPSTPTPLLGPTPRQSTAPQARSTLPPQSNLYPRASVFPEAVVPVHPPLQAPAFLPQANPTVAAQGPRRTYQPPAALPLAQPTSSVVGEQASRSVPVSTTGEGQPVNLPKRGLLSTGIEIASGKGLEGTQPAGASGKQETAKEPSIVPGEALGPSPGFAQLTSPPAVDDQPLADTKQAASGVLNPPVSSPPGDYSQDSLRPKSSHGSRGPCSVQSPEELNLAPPLEAPSPIHPQIHPVSQNHPVTSLPDPATSDPLSSLPPRAPNLTTQPSLARQASAQMQYQHPPGGLSSPGTNPLTFTCASCNNAQMLPPLPPGTHHMRCGTCGSVNEVQTAPPQAMQPSPAVQPPPAFTSQPSFSSPYAQPQVFSPGSQGGGYGTPPSPPGQTMRCGACGNIMILPPMEPGVHQFQCGGCRAVNSCQVQAPAVQSPTHPQLSSYPSYNQTPYSAPGSGLTLKEKIKKNLKKHMDLQKSGGSGGTLFARPGSGGQLYPAQYAHQSQAVYQQPNPQEYQHPPPLVNQQTPLQGYQQTAQFNHSQAAQVVQPQTSQQGYQPPAQQTPQQMYQPANDARFQQLPQSGPAPAPQPGYPQIQPGYAQTQPGYQQTHQTVHPQNPQSPPQSVSEQSVEQGYSFTPPQPHSPSPPVPANQQPPENPPEELHIPKAVVYLPVTASDPQPPVETPPSQTPPGLEAYLEDQLKITQSPPSSAGSVRKPESLPLSASNLSEQFKSPPKVPPANHEHAGSIPPMSVRPPSGPTPVVSLQPASDPHRVSGPPLPLQANASPLPPPTMLNPQPLFPSQQAYAPPVVATSAASPYPPPPVSPTFQPPPQPPAIHPTPSDASSATSFFSTVTNPPLPQKQRGLYSIPSDASSVTSFSSGVSNTPGLNQWQPPMSLAPAAIWVNGQRLSEELTEAAEVLAGPIERGGFYWYDPVTGFWGEYGKPCQGVLPPGIPEFNFLLPPDAAGGTTGIYVNGRQLAARDLAMLRQRGFPQKERKKYTLDFGGTLKDAETGKVVMELGKLAQSVEENGVGRGMKKAQFAPPPLPVQVSKPKLSNWGDLRTMLRK